MRPPAIRDAEDFRAFATAVERLCESGVLTDEQRARLAEVRCVAVGTRRVRGMHLPGERVVVVHEGAGLGVWAHELAHATLGVGGDAQGEAAACDLAARLGGHGAGTDAGVLVANGPPDYFAFRREDDRIRVEHEKCGRECETWHPTMPGREAHVLALCEACGVTACVPLNGECCGTQGPMRWTASASPAEPSVERRCDTCGSHEVLALVKPQHQAPAPERIYAERTRSALTQVAQRLHRVAAGELDPALLDGVLGGAWHSAARVEPEVRARVEAALRGARELIDGGELTGAAETLEAAAKALD